MSDYIFIFDLDATITKVEILPKIAECIGCEARMKEITEKTMTGEIPFKQSFLDRVGILKAVPVSEVRKVVDEIPLNDELAEFIRTNSERCYVMTGNLDVWIEGLMDKLGLSKDHYYCSHAVMEGDYITEVAQVLDKGIAIAAIKQPFVAVGDGNNDAEMIAAAEVGIGFGGVRDVAMSVLKSATHAAYSEEKLCQFLKQLL